MKSFFRRRGFAGLSGQRHIVPWGSRADTGKHEIWKVCPAMSDLTEIPNIGPATTCAA